MYSNIFQNSNLLFEIIDEVWVLTCEELDKYNNNI